MCAHPAHDVRLAHGAWLTGDLAAALEERQSGNAADAELAGESGLGVSVDLRQARHRFQFRGRRGVLGGHHLAWTAPGSPEVHDDRHIAVLDLPVETRAGELGRVAGEKRLVTMPALGRLTEARRGNAVDLLAVRTYQVQRFSHARGMGSAAAVFKTKAARSDALLPRPQVELECPRAAVLMMQIPEGFGDRVRFEQRILRTSLLQLRIAR